MSLCIRWKSHSMNCRFDELPPHPKLKDFKFSQELFSTRRTRPTGSRSRSRSGPPASRAGTWPWPALAKERKGRSLFRPNWPTERKVNGAEWFERAGRGQTLENIHSMIDWVTRDKNSCSLQKYINYTHKKLNILGPWGPSYKTFCDCNLRLFLIS